VVWVQHFADRPYLMLQWHDPATGKRKSKSAETCNPVEAEIKRADLESDLNHGRYAEPARMTWERFRELFEEEYVAGQRERSREKYGSVLDVFEQIVEPAKLRDLDERALSRFLKGMREKKRPGERVGLAPMTMKNYLVALKTALGWAVSQKLLPTLPEFPAVKVPKKKPQPIPSESFERLLAKAPDAFWRAFLLCGWWCGLRLSEAYCLRWERSDKLPYLDLAADRIILPAVFAKSDEDQWVPLHPTLREALEALPRTHGADVFFFRSRRGGGRLTRNGVTNRVLDLAKTAGVRLSMHRLRKGFGCRVAKDLGRGAAPVLHRLMRHSSMQVTMDYYASVDDALHDAIKGLT
jgi:integrase